MAGAAVGVSHLVQSTRAGAEYGLLLIGLVLAGCALKYPFLEFGPRYAAATGEHMIEGYRRLGKWPLGVFAFLTVATMFIVLASVTIVTAGLAGTMFGLQLPVGLPAFIILFACALILTIGHYRGLDLLMKIIMAVLSLATLAAVALAAGQRTEWASLMPALPDTQLLSGAGLAFVLAVAFLTLGALIMHGGGQAPAGSAVAFSSQLIAMYTGSLGEWARPLIAFAALATMLSTTLTVADAYPRVLRAFLELADPGAEQQRRKHRARYLGGMLLTMTGAWIIIALYVRHGVGRFPGATETPACSASCTKLATCHDRRSNADS